jgi:hypothetical protein
VGAGKVSLGGRLVLVLLGAGSVLVGAASVSNATRVSVAWAKIAAWVCRSSKLSGAAPTQETSIKHAASKRIAPTIVFFIIPPVLINHLNKVQDALQDLLLPKAPWHNQRPAKVQHLLKNTPTFG